MRTPFSRIERTASRAGGTPDLFVALGEAAQERRSAMATPIDEIRCFRERNLTPAS